MLRKLFIDHPASVDEGYFEHMWFAASFAGLLFAAGLAALIHAVIPGLCKTTASRLIRKMYARIEYRGVPAAAPAE
ncbi:DUF6356 family protein [Aestuariivita boseongensis]|uniref:DUF6356 family protein n=1 Tax=Aestuariivita boseongensis TaxID=1470562 RepID=UPI000682C9CD|nr:DUF6356 family protein [Aestuariivita boseongensis]